MKLPPLTSLRAFEAAARHGSLSAAARELNVTHAAVKQQVKKLEDWFGLSLMHREGRGVATTEKGARLAAGLGDGFAAIQSAVETLTEDDASRPLRITTTPSFTANWLMPRLGLFRADHPEIEIMLNPTVATVDLIAEDYDLGIRFGRGKWPGLEAEKIIDSGVTVAAAPSVLKGRDIRTPADLASLPWVQELGMDERGVWLAAHGVEDIGQRNVMHVPGYLVLDAVRRGEGIGIVGHTWLEEDIAAGRIVSLFSEETGPDIGYWMTYRPGPHRAPLKAFLRWVRREAS